MKLHELDRNLLDLNNEKIPEVVMEKFWKLKEELGTKPVGVSKIGDIYYIISPAFEKYILWEKRISVLK